MAETDEAAGGAAAGTAVPPPPALHLSRVTWEKDRVIHRIHDENYPGIAFNPGLRGNARFSPIRDRRDSCHGDAPPIPTLYGGDTFECAAMETVFHDVPYGAGVKFYDKGKLAGQIYTQLVPAADLVLADLGSKALRKLGVQRRQLIDTEKDQYPVTRQWAEAIQARHPDVQGLCWVSRQDDGARALVLFGDRLPDGSLKQVSVPASLTGHADCYGDLLALDEHIGVNIIPGKV
jgi:hypothetical protein